MNDAQCGRWARVDQSHHESGKGRLCSYCALNLKSVLTRQEIGLIDRVELVVAAYRVKDAVSRIVRYRTQV